MSTATDQYQQPIQPASQPPGTDPVLLLLLGIVVALVLGTTGYLCLAHPSLVAPLGAMGTMASVLIAAFGIAFALRRR
ncbi:hypothetical protein ACF053_27215 [Streptomyces kanasensis]|uniref:hypothetical protein n=1 Tax=Streptomyces kanasensis TaxID=936756 RepID=UPI0036FC0FB0